MTATHPLAPGGQRACAWPPPGLLCLVSAGKRMINHHLPRHFHALRPPASAQLRASRGRPSCVVLVQHMTPATRCNASDPRCLPACLAACARRPFSGGKLMHAHLGGRLPRGTLVVGYTPGLPGSRAMAPQPSPPACVTPDHACDKECGVCLLLALCASPLTCILNYTADQSYCSACWHAMFNISNRMQATVQEGQDRMLMNITVQLI